MERCRLFIDFKNVIPQPALTIRQRLYTPFIKEKGKKL